MVTDTAANGKLGCARDAFVYYYRTGIYSLPVPYRSKNPGLLNGQNYGDLRLTPADLDEKFPKGRKLNIAVLLGIASGGLADIDLDVGQAIIAGPHFLPKAGWVFGRESARSAHHEYRVADELETHQFKDIDGSMIAELRYNGVTIYPPGWHQETGEKIEWERLGDLTEVWAGELVVAVSCVAAATILAIHWPAEGGRQDAAQHLAGGLMRAEWPENKVCKFVTAVCEAAGDGEAKQRISAVRPTAKKLAADKATAGWPKLAELVGEKVVERVREWLEIETARPEPVIVPEQPWPEPMASAAFHGPAGELVRAIEPHSEADPHALLIQTLVMAGNVVGRTAHWRTEGDTHYLNEFAVLLGDTSKARKGSSFGIVRRFFACVAPDWLTERLQGGLSSGEGLIWSIRDAIYKMKDGEEQLQDPGIDDKRLVCFEPEFASILKHTERTGNTLSVIARQAWDGHPLRAMTKNSPAVCMEPHVSIIGHCTVEEVRRYLTATEQASGFGNRFCWLCATRSKVLPEGGRVIDAEMSRLVPLFEQPLKRAVQVGCMGFTEAGRRAWHLVYGDLSEGKPGLGGAMLGRAEAHVRRIACVYALLDGQSNVDVVHLQAAVAIWEYCEASVLYVFGQQTGDPLADEILGALRGCPDGLTLDNIRQFFQRHQRSIDVARALALLLKFRLAYPAKEKTGGRRAERWRAGRAPTPTTN
jgi:hypothetical protein